MLEGQASLEGRFGHLVRAAESIVGELSLSAVLREIVLAACELTRAPFGALGVLSPTGDGLEQFVHVGVDDETAAAIGDLPRGRGLLGALIVDPHTIRLDDLTQDPRAVGFPAQHPPMRGFLGVPVLVRGEVFGNLYLATLADHPFSVLDEQLVEALAGLAGIAIQNARLYDEAAQRQRWLEASTAFSQELLITDQDAVHRLCELVLDHADADTVTLVRPSPDGAHLDVVSAAGEGAASVQGMRYPRDHTYAGRVLDTAAPVVLNDAADPGEVEGHFVHVAKALVVGPLMVIPLQGPSGPGGALSVSRGRGRRSFNRAELDMAITFAGHAAVALELGEARQARERAALLEDRARIARDLHDHVIQQLFGAGLTLQAAVPAQDPAGAEILEDVIERLDDSIRQIRAAIFGLRPRTAVDGTLRDELLQTAREAGRGLGFEPAMRFDGPIELVADRALVGDVVAVAREALANAARHAHATWVGVRVHADAESLVVTVEDDGVGVVGVPAGASGLRNLQSRAENRGGTLTVEGRRGGGTALRWVVRLPGSAS